MGTTPGTHTTPNTVPAQAHEAGQDSQALPAKEFLARRRQSIEAEAAAEGSAKSTSNSIAPALMEAEILAKAMKAIDSSKEILSSIVSGSWIASTRDQASARVAELISGLTATGTLAAGDAVLVLDLGSSERSRQLQLLSAILPPLFREYKSGYNSTEVSNALTAVTRALGKKDLQSVIQSKKRVFAGAIQALDKLGHDLSPQGQEANRRATIDTAVAAAVQRYGNSDECRALKLLALISDRADGVAVDDKEMRRMVRNLQHLGADGAQQLLLGLTHALEVEAEHVNTLRELFAEHAAELASQTREPSVTSEKSTETDEGSQGSVAVGVTYQDALASQPAYDPELVDYALEHDLGIRNPRARARLSRLISVQNLESVTATLRRAPLHLVSAVLDDNPDLINPAHKVNLASYVADLNEFLRIGYGHLQTRRFNPTESPSNFSSPEQLSDTLKSLKAELHKRS